MTKHFYLTFAILLLVTSGCLEFQKYKYSIEMKPSGRGIERKLTYPRNLPEEKRSAIAKLYEKHVDPNIFWGRFDTNLPNDVGGAGFYSTLDANMGRTAFYSERFRGDDNLNDTLQKILMIADRSVDFLIGWLEHELGDDPNFANLKAFGDKNVRHDIKNMAIYFLLSNILAEYESDGYREILMRMQHYVAERGYLGPKQVCLLAASSDVDNKQILRLLRQWIADKMGYSSPEIADERLGFLSNGERAEESMKQYIRTTDFFAKAWEAKKLKENNPNAAQPDIDVGDFVLHDIDFEIISFSFSSTEVEVRLACTNQPFDTNGQWNGQANQVAWASQIAGDEGLPTFFYASWSEPDKKFQQEHFGQVVLSGAALAEYCMWRSNLGQVRGEEWDSFVVSLKPGEDLEGRLNEFRFLTERQEELDKQKSDLAQKPRELILAGLKSEEIKKDDTKIKADDE